MEKIDDLITEDISLQNECNLCEESKLNVRSNSDYGSIIVCKVGNSDKDGWFATLSPKTGSGDNDFTIQLMPLGHLTHFCQVNNYPKLAKNYGIIFSKVSEAMSRILAEENAEFSVSSTVKTDSVSIATYGKCTNWKEKKEHLHIKIFPFRGDIGQPYTVDSSFGRKEIIDEGSKNEFVKMNPVRKVMIKKERFEFLSKKLISLLK